MRHSISCFEHPRLPGENSAKSGSALCVVKRWSKTHFGRNGSHPGVVIISRVQQDRPFHWYDAKNNNSLQNATFDDFRVFHQIKRCIDLMEGMPQTCSSHLIIHEIQLSQKKKIHNLPTSQGLAANHFLSSTMSTSRRPGWLQRLFQPVPTETIEICPCSVCFAVPSPRNQPIPAYAYTTVPRKSTNGSAPGKSESACYLLLPRSKAEAEIIGYYYYHHPTAMADAGRRSPSSPSNSSSS